MKSTHALQDIFDDCELQVTEFTAVNGGDINEAYALHTKDDHFFLKVNDALAFPGMFDKEADGLSMLKNAAGLIVPTVIRAGCVGNRQYLLMEWLPEGAPAKNFWQYFGTGVANLHRATAPHFGWREHNYIGSLVQNNDLRESWPEFYTSSRIMPLVQQLYDSGLFGKKDISQADKLCRNAAHIFPAELPALQHGDLWSGNFMVHASGKAAIFDPAVYYGHREMDLGLTRLFGGFHEDFFAAYQEAYPLQSGWEQRQPFTQLYPVLVHAILFQGHYISVAKEILSGLKF